MEEPEVQRVLSLVQKAIEFKDTNPKGKEYLSYFQNMIKSQEEAIRIFGGHRFDVTAHVEYWVPSEYKKVPNRYMQIPSPVPDTDTAFLIVESNVIDAGLSIEYIVQQYFGVKEFIYFAIVIPGVIGNYGIEWAIETYVINQWGEEA